MNHVLSTQIIKKILESGTVEFCICPGARNAPLVATLLEFAKESPIRVYTFFEERSAAFFALGRIKATDRPVAVVTTSGTAAGELLPAAMEAHYSGLPLLLLTADRPRRFRWTGAPQSAEQVGLFGVYVEQCLDVAGNEGFDFGKWSRRQPLHLNVCFEEPLLTSGPRTLVEYQPDFPALFETGADRLETSSTELPDDRDLEAALGRLDDFLATVRFPLVVVGSLRAEDRDPVARCLEALGAPVYLEGPSGLRDENSLKSLRIHAPERLIERSREAGYPIDGILRIGGVPTLRLWRDLEALEGKLPVCSVNREPFSGLSWAPMITMAPGRLFEHAFKEHRFAFRESARGFFESETALGVRISALLLNEPLSEPGMFRALSAKLPNPSRLFLGNSLPIREWDLAAAVGSNAVEIGANRGLNGIDGQLSTFFGFCKPGVSNWAILGDLTTLYDLSAPWVLPQLGEINASIVVVNNHGGKIFSRLFPHPEFQNAHAIDFAAWAAMWRLPYQAWTELPAALPAFSGSRVIELLPDEAATERFFRQYDFLCQ